MWASLSSPAFLVHVWLAVQVQKGCLKVNIDHCYVEVVLITVISILKCDTAVFAFLFFFENVGKNVMSDDLCQGVCHH